MDDKTVSTVMQGAVNLRLQIQRSDALIACRAIEGLMQELRACYGVHELEGSEYVLRAENALDYFRDILEHP